MTFSIWYQVTCFVSDPNWDEVTCFVTHSCDRNLYNTHCDLGSCGMLPDIILSSQYHCYYILLLIVTNIIVQSSTELNGDRCIWKAPFSPFTCAKWHASRIFIELTVSLSMLTVTNITKKSSTELNGDRCIWKVHISPFFCAMWHDPRNLIELKESLLLYFIIFYYRHWPT